MFEIKFNMPNMSKGANAFLKQIAGVIGLLHDPDKIIPKAKAKAEAAVIRAESEIQVTDLQRQAAWRRENEDIQQQKNIHDTIAKALPLVDEKENPKLIEHDWKVNFFDKCRLISDKEMQSLWARVLAGEANSPGSYSKRTVNFLTDMDKKDAELFEKLCGFTWMINNEVSPLIFSHQDEIYKKNGINFGNLTHLESIGLIKLGSHFNDFVLEKQPKEFKVYYHGEPLSLVMPKNTDKQSSGVGVHEPTGALVFHKKTDEQLLPVGQVLLTNLGHELAPICKSEPVEGFFDYVKIQWKEYLPKSG